MNWGDLDYLLIDTPPGTSDEHLSIVSYLKKTKIDGAVVVTTPQVRNIAILFIILQFTFIKKLFGVFFHFLTK